mmetsp:Transcript_28948/g.46689  ORF Transcript_28948/g.46689 Transcript_28948/m.46689 type:complete len:207 (+) Transcript_28948:168-788(+)
MPNHCNIYSCFMISWTGSRNADSSSAKLASADNSCSSSFFFLVCISRMFSSTVPFESNLIIVTGLVWPIRWHLSSACLSIVGLKSKSWIITVSALVRLIPIPPARVLSKKTFTEWSPLKVSTSFCLSPIDVDPSNRTYFNPSTDTVFSIMSSIVVHWENMSIRCPFSISSGSKCCSSFIFAEVHNASKGNCMSLSNILLAPNSIVS